MKKRIRTVLLLIGAALLLGCEPAEEQCAKKPVIYLYPEQKTEVSVELLLDGELTCTYPEYDQGWNVTAYPDGQLVDETGMRYNYLYWEGKTSQAYNMSEGFCVAGKDTAAFLENALEKLGLTRQEANEFIVYWLPQMQENPYNLISFQTNDYTDHDQLKISPEPDTLIRVFMTWKPLEKPQQIPEQSLCAPKRSGFTVVEWGAEASWRNDFRNKRICPVDSAVQSAVYCVKSIQIGACGNNTPLKKLFRRKTMSKSQKNAQWTFHDAINAEPAGEGVVRRVLAYCDELMCVENVFEIGGVGKLHQHPHTQITYVAEGVFEFTIGDTTKIVRKGDTLLKQG